jgi:hypothetical protein
MGVKDVEMYPGDPGLHKVRETACRQELGGAHDWNFMDADRVGSNCPSTGKRENFVSPKPAQEVGQLGRVLLASADETYWGTTMAILIWVFFLIARPVSFVSDRARIDARSKIE